MRRERYGDYLRPLDIDALLKIIEERSDPSVVRFIELVDRTCRAEMISKPSSWTEAEKEAWAQDDWRSFSTLRGYSEDEIRDFAEYIDLAHALDLKYGDDFSASISHLVQEQIGACGW
jgi:hypothetical protein